MRLRRNKGISYQNRSLIATENVLCGIASNSHHVSFEIDNRYNFGTKNFTVSIIVQLQAGYALELQGATAALRFLLDTNMMVAVTNQGTVCNSGNGSLLTSNSLSRLTIIRRGTSIEFWFNTRLINQVTIPSNDSFDLSHLSNTGRIGSRFNNSEYFTGYVSNAIVINGYALSVNELNGFHNSNILPSSSHAYVIAHYPLNQNEGLKAWDVVEQYNYAKLLNDGTLEYQYATAVETYADGDYIEFTTPTNSTNTHDWMAGFFDQDRPLFTGITDSTLSNIARGTEPNVTIIHESQSLFPIWKNGAGPVTNLSSDAVIGDVLRITRSGNDLLFTKNTVSTGSLVNALTTGVKYIVVQPKGSGGVPVINKNGVNLTYNKFYKTELSSGKIIKTGALRANHGDLINYTNDEVGITNPLLQTAWQNLYSKNKKGKNFLKFNGTTGYGEIETLAGYNPGSDFVFAMSFVPDSDFSGSPGLFCNRDNIGQPLTFLYPYNNTIGFRRYKSDGTGQIDVGLNTYQTILNNRELNVVVIVAQYTGGTTYRLRSYIKRYSGGHQSSTFGLFIHSSSLVTGNDYSYAWEKFLIANDRGMAGRVGKNSYGKFVFIKNPFTQYPLDWNDANSTNLLINRLLNINENDEYRSLLLSLTTLFDIDFGDVFQNTDYYARDYSGNNNHCKLFNWIPATDQPLRQEQNTGLPERRKAIKLSKALNNCFKVANFNPTKENGYTYHFGFVFIPGFNNHGLMGKAFGGPYGSPYKFIVSTFPVTTDIGIYDSTVQARYSMSKMNIYKPNFLTIQEYWNPTTQFYHYRIYINGIKVLDTGGGTPTNTTNGFDAMDTDLWIGAQGLNAGAVVRGLEGYLFHASIWKEYSSEYKIKNWVNNALRGNTPSREMTNCELYLTFDEAYNDAGTLKIKDWSPQNRTVIMNGYTVNDITPGDPDYKFVDLDTLR